MRTRTALGLAAVFSCAVLVTAVGVGRNGDDGGAALLPPPSGPYVALGDSSTAGPEFPGQNGKPAGCDRSDRNYPSLVARELGVEQAEFRGVSCSGATLGDLSTPQATDNGTNAAQLNAVSEATRPVTLGTGGNGPGAAPEATVEARV